MGMYGSLFQQRTKVSLEKQGDSLDRHVQRLQSSLSEKSQSVSRKAQMRRASAAAARIDPTDGSSEDTVPQPDPQEHI
eukprot:6893690-Prymnesium_polylepis.1